MHVVCSTLSGDSRGGLIRATDGSDPRGVQRDSAVRWIRLTLISEQCVLGNRCCSAERVDALLKHWTCELTFKYTHTQRTLERWAIVNYTHSCVKNTLIYSCVVDAHATI